MCREFALENEMSREADISYATACDAQAKTDAADETELVRSIGGQEQGIKIFSDVNDLQSPTFSCDHLNCQSPFTGLASLPRFIALSPFRLFRCPCSSIGSFRFKSFCYFDLGVRSNYFNYFPYVKHYLFVKIRVDKGACYVHTTSWTRHMIFLHSGLFEKLFVFIQVLPSYDL